MATFNGYLIVPMPSSPAPRSIEWNATDAVAALVSPFSGQQQIQNWQAGWLSASVTMPPMKDSHARAWVGQRRRSDRFHAGHQRLDSERRGRSAAGRFTSDRVPPLYKSDGAERRNGSGNAIASIWPNIRESPADATAIALSNTQGIWRLENNARSWSISEMKTYGLTFKIREAI